MSSSGNPAQHHGVAVARAGVGRGAGEVDAARPARGEDGEGGVEAVERAVVQVPGDDAAAAAVLVHDEVDREILDEELGPPLERLAVKRVEDGVAGAVGRGTGAMGRALAELRRHAAEGALIDLALGRAREGHAVVLELDHRRDRLAAHVFDGVLVAEPVGTLDRVVHVPAPIVRAHVAEGGADAALRRDRVAARGEDLADAGRLQSLLGDAEGGPQPGAAGADHHHVVVMVDELVCLCHQPITPKATRTIPKMLPAASSTAANLTMRMAASFVLSLWT